jgi:hypothetical protein
MARAVIRAQEAAMLEEVVVGGCSILHTLEFRLGFRVNSARRACYCAGDDVVLLAGYWSRRRKMPWYTYVAYFFGGMFLVNAVPHFVSGVMGRKFPSPFASPPGKGESSPMVNVLWGAVNLVTGYLLVFRVGDFLIRDAAGVAALGIGGLVMAVMLARNFGKVYGGK